ncbi:MAG TPA: hypothetical protein PLB31_08305 [Fimbriimonadaceae bacterium]|nr:hypothetical protein [Armatimonadota bacterium]HCM73473.1 hypothetical protein [Armatimonadota bacterium]HRD30467.1 hypothetical protein [Fimbriimonadaceae bacterium]HRE92873.1 hypothetical protein [Fimbriimonadaceae bacterium]HRI74458.1 hypothetical protein [Fimbriimonadaceae bacterium]
MSETARPLLVVTYGGGHAFIGQAVAQEWKRRGGTVVALALTTARRIYDAAGIENIGFRDLIAPQDEAAHHYGKALSEGIPPHPDVCPEETEAYLGLSYADLVQEHGETKAEELFTTQGRRAFRPVTAIQRCLDRFNPVAVLATNSPRAEQTALCVAQKQGLPNVCAVDLFARYDLDRLGQPDYAKNMCVITEADRQLLVESGWNPAHIHVTGNPAFDRLVSEEFASQGAAIRRRLPPGRIILFASQPTAADPGYGPRMAHALAPAVHNWGGHLVVRPHPNEVWSLDDLPTGVTVSPTTEPVEAWLHAVDYVATATSTVGLQAALLGRGILELETPAGMDHFSYAEMGLAASLPADALTETGIRQALATPCPGLSQLPKPGQGAARVADVIAQAIAR